MQAKSIILSTVLHITVIAGFIAIILWPEMTQHKPKAHHITIKHDQKIKATIVSPSAFKTRQNHNKKNQNSDKQSSLKKQPLNRNKPKNLVSLDHEYTKKANRNTRKKHQNSNQKQINQNHQLPKPQLKKLYTKVTHALAASNINKKLTFNIKALLTRKGRLNDIHIITPKLSAKTKHKLIQKLKSIRLNKIKAQQGQKPHSFALRLPVKID